MSSEEAGDEITGTVEMDLQIGPSVTVNTVSWTISNATSGFTRSGTVNVKFSNNLQFLAGAIPAGSGYTILLAATSVDGTFANGRTYGTPLSADSLV